MDLRTDRLILRQWRDGDREPFAAMNASPVVMEHFPARMTRSESDAFVDRMAARIDGEGWGLWALELAATGEFIGFTGLSVPSFDAHFTPTVEVGWRLPVRAWGHGYASEAARYALAYGLDELGLEEIVSFTTRTNVRSQAVMQRIGMTHDPADDFDHPNLDSSSPLREHVLYRARPTS
ncbi:GNAT family N-acetyltransferase [Solicola gregarius]|uniref:GNAT family N-acetyltransferase n=1 Tax=Solicola gregarius TaxID=2908642 RepID=A0AA46TJD1_9ACTN|nr:GNAT family N-acetyltransferase [Solicola gregarius]UYM06391.1 GNAT family N-acetyltransferase [Solicola gregarius]